MLECLGDKPCHFILIFDNGYFSEFGTFSITDWIGHTPKALLAKNFGLPEPAFERFPKEEVYFARGKPPPAEPAAPLQGWKLPPETHKYRLLAQPPHRAYQGGREWRVDSTRFPISKTITGVILDLDPGALRTLHWHPNADEWQYVIEGEVSVTLFGSHGRYRTETLQKGDVGYIPQGYGHSIENVGRQARAHPDRVQHRHLRDHRPVAMDRGKSHRRARHQFQPAGGAVRKISRSGRVHREREGGWQIARRCLGSLTRLRRVTGLSQRNSAKLNLA